MSPRERSRQLIFKIAQELGNTDLTRVQQSKEFEIMMKYITPELGRGGPSVFQVAVGLIVLNVLSNTILYLKLSGGSH